jgi:hypothetical protein
MESTPKPNPRYLSLGPTIVKVTNVEDTSIFAEYANPDVVDKSTVPVVKVCPDMTEIIKKANTVKVKFFIAI